MYIAQGFTAAVNLYNIALRPGGDTQLRYLINEIDFAEETDEDPSGQRMSHYEMYLDVMQAAGINTTKAEGANCNKWTSIDGVSKTAASNSRHVYRNYRRLEKLKSFHCLSKIKYYFDILTGR
jgi:hypothetical protein